MFICTYVCVWTVGVNIHPTHGDYSRVILIAFESHGCKCNLILLTKLSIMASKVLMHNSYHMVRMASSYNCHMKMFILRGSLDVQIHLL
jgi:hypothetical protein